jgi:hypothetical protein
VPATDEDELSICYFFLERWQMPPNVTMAQEEAIVNDIMAMDKQVNFKKWSRAHGLYDDDDDDLPPDPTVKDYRSTF